MPSSTDELSGSTIREWSEKKFSSQLGNFTPSKGKFNSINNNTELILRQERILLLLQVVETNNFRLQILVALSILPTILYSKQETFIWNQSGPKAGFGDVKQLTFCFWPPWEKFREEHHVKLWDGTKLFRFAESASSNIVLYSRFI